MKKKKYDQKKIVAYLRIALLIVLLTILVVRWWSVLSARKTVWDYNLLLSMAYQRLSSEPLQEIVSRNELDRVSFLVAAYGFNKEKPEASLKNLDFVSVSWGLNEVMVKTKERWLFSLVDLTTSQQKESAIYDYQMLYKLRRSGLRWKVEKKKVLDEKRKRL